MPTAPSPDIFGKMDMGQGLSTAISQMIAEELDVPVKTVKLIMGDTAQTINQGGASSSNGVQNGGKQLAVAAAEARRVLIEMAATKLSIPADQLTVTDGVISSKSDPSKKATYAELIGGRYFNVELAWNKQIGNGLYAPGQAKIKKPSEHKIVGQSVKRTDVAPKAFAQQGFVTDVKRDGMLHARMIRPPVAGSVPVKVDEASLKDIPGAKVVLDKGFLAVVADKEWDAIKASQALKVEWSQVTPPFPNEKDLFDYIRKTPVRKSEIDDKSKSGDVDEAFKNATRVIEAEYEWPFQSHACMGPGCAVVEIKAIRRRCGPARRSRITSATASPPRSGCRPTRYVPSGSPAPVATAATTPATPPWTPPSSRKRPAVRRACNTRANRAPAGIRKAPPRCTRCAPRSMLPARS